MNPDEFYILPPSTAPLEEFPHNTSNQYKVRLPQQLRLSGNQWRVGLASISLLDSKANIGKLVPKTGAGMTMTWAKVKQGRRAGYTLSVTMGELEDMASVTDGEHLMRAIMESFEKENMQSAEPGALFTTQDGSENLYATFQWIPNGKDVDLLIENSKTFLDGRTYVLGPNLLHEVHSCTFSTDPNGNPSCGRSMNISK